MRLAELQETIKTASNMAHLLRRNQAEAPETALRQISKSTKRAELEAMRFVELQETINTASNIAYVFLAPFFEIY